MKKIWKRDYRHFNNREFLEELGKIDWVKTLAGTSVEEAFSIFCTTVDDILNVMAPTKLLSRKEIGIVASPWLTKGILKSMDTRDNLYKSFVTEVRPDTKEYLHKQYKSYRNLLLTLQRVSKKNYYAEYFSGNAENVRKTCSGIKEIINVSKSSIPTSPVSINYNNTPLSTEKDIANTMNEFFVNVGPNLEKDIQNSTCSYLDFLGPSTHN